MLHVVADEMCGVFEWAQSDCCKAAARVFARLWGVDPMAGWPDYSGAHGALRSLGGRGAGWARAVAWGAAQAGLKPAAPHPGALALVPADAPAFGNRAVAICIRPGLWAARSGDGYTLVMRALGHWGLTCHR